MTKPKDEVGKTILAYESGFNIGRKIGFSEGRQQTAQEIFKDYENELLYKYQTYRESKMTHGDIFMKIHNKIKQKYLKGVDK